MNNDVAWSTERGTEKISRQTGGCVYFRHLTSHFSMFAHCCYFFPRTKFASRYIRQHKEIAKSKPAVQSRIRISSSVAVQLLHVRIRGLFILSCAVEKVLTSQSSNNSPGGVLTQLRRTINVTQRKRVEQTCKQILHKVKCLNKHVKHSKMERIYLVVAPEFRALKASSCVFWFLKATTKRPSM